ncbi:MAG: CpaF family protein [Planctomycetes bacterium]|nr:CpaF family protein [Planctomycetota bacterium]
MEPAIATVDEPEEDVQETTAEVSTEETAAEAERNEWFLQLKSELHRQVIGKMDLATLGTMAEDELRLEVRRSAEELLRTRSDLLNVAEQERLVEEVIDETFGLGPLEPLFRDESITDIMINGPDVIYIERGGRLERTGASFANDAHLIQIIQRIVSAVGRRIDETSPMVDARLKDGSRVNAIIPPLAIDGALVSIRRFGSKPLGIDELIKHGSITPEMVQFLAACVNARINILISGGTGSGKTTLLNALSGYIPEDERVATIEDAAELQLQQPHVVRMETRPANVEGSGEVTTRDLVRNALRMRPDRIVVGECRGPEALDMLQAMNTGHDGSLTTVHANSPRDAISRIEMMVGMAGFDLPIWTIRRQIASAIQIVVQASRLTGGARKVTAISEITGMEGDILSMHDLFTYKQTGLDDDRRAVGYFMATGIRPNLLERLEISGCSLPPDLFEQRVFET